MEGGKRDGEKRDGEKRVREESEGWRDGGRDGRMEEGKSYLSCGLVVVPPIHVLVVPPFCALVVPSFRVLVVWSSCIIVVLSSHVVVACGHSFVFALGCSCCLGGRLRCVNCRWHWARVEVGVELAVIQWAYNDEQ